MKCLTNVRIVREDRIEEGRKILFDTKIRAILPEKAPVAEAEMIDGRGLYAMPGLIDVHSHGCLGEDATTSDEEGIRRMCRSLAGDGVTSWLPTTMTYPLPELAKAFDRIGAVQKQSRQEPDTWDGAQILGVNMEGPFISKARKGAHLEDYIIAPDPSILLQYQDLIRLVTIAPETEGAMDLIRLLREKTDIRVSVGHTAIGYEEAQKAFAAGATEVTHLFNAMTGIHHRDPGLAGAALTAKNVYCELIADTFHIHKGLFQMIADCKGDHLVLITDSMRAAGLPEGTYDLGAQQVHVRGICCRLADGTIAGSVLRLNQAVRNLYENTDWTLPKAVAAASLNPARAIGADRKKGSIEEGKDADLVLADSRLHIYETYIGGKRIYEDHRL